MENKKYFILILSGGALKTAWIAGLCSVLKEYGYTPLIISAASGAAPIAGLWAGSMNKNGIIEYVFFNVLDWNEIFYWGRFFKRPFGVKSVIGTPYYTETMISKSVIQGIDSGPKVEISVVDARGILRIIEATPENIRDLCMASTAVPLFCSPHRMNGSVYRDSFLSSYPDLRIEYYKKLHPDTPIVVASCLSASPQRVNRQLTGEKVYSLYSKNIVEQSRRMSGLYKKGHSGVYMIKESQSFIGPAGKFHPNHWNVKPDVDKAFYQGVADAKAHLARMEKYILNFKSITT